MRRRIAQGAIGDFSGIDFGCHFHRRQPQQRRRFQGRWCPLPTLQPGPQGIPDGLDQQSTRSAYRNSPAWAGTNAKPYRMPNNERPRRPGARDLRYATTPLPGLPLCSSKRRGMNLVRLWRIQLLQITKYIHFMEIIVPSVVWIIVVFGLRISIFGFGPSRSWTGDFAGVIFCEEISGTRHYRLS
jgi:hypothetical protein